LSKVQQLLSKVFGDKLARNEVAFTEPTAISTDTKPAAPKDAAPKDTTGAATAVKPDVPAAQPAGEKPAADKPAAPADNKPQTRVDLPSDRLVAMADDSLVLAVLGQDPAAKPEASTAAATPAATDKPAETPAAAQPETPAVPAQTPAVPQATGPAVPVMTQTLVGGSESTLTFTMPLNAKSVEELIKAAVEKTQVASEMPLFQLDAEGYVSGQSKAFAKWTVKILLPPEKAKVLFTEIQSHLKATPFFPASNKIGGAVAGNTQRVAVYALIASWLGIVIYLWVRFQGVAFGLAAVIALVHDVLVMLGAIAVSIYIAPYFSWMMIEPFKINLPIIAAFLTIVGYSVNDTIVVFDRIREVRGKDPNMTRKMVNDSTNQTMSRTLLTSLTVLLVVVVLYFFGGYALHGFAFALVVGVLTGTYSSIYVAAPTLIWMLGHAQNHGETEVKKA
jgi:SecD/SecF fusion protein